MPRIICTIIVVALFALVAVWGISAIMGDDWKPFKKTVHENLKDSLLALVDDKEMALERVEGKIAEVRTVVGRTAREHARSRARIHQFERRLTAASQQLELDRLTVARIEKRLSEGRRVRPRGSDKNLTPEETGLRLDKEKLRVELGEEKVRVLKSMRDRSAQHISRIEHFSREAPVRLAKLELRRDHLRAKVGFYNDLANMGGEEFDGFNDVFSEAESVLDQAHAELDAELAEVTAFFDTRWDKPLDLGDEADMLDRLDIDTTVERLDIDTTATTSGRDQ